jgi:hypothetical protein
MTGFYYLEPASMPSDMITSKVMAVAAPVTSATEEPQKAKAGVNPVVVGAAGVVVAAAAVGVGVAAKKSSDRKKAAAQAAAGTGEKGSTKDGGDRK